MHERALARAGDAGHRDEDAGRDVDRDVPQWWNARAPILDEFLPFDVRVERFPMIVRLAGEQAYEEVGHAEPGGPSYLEAEALDTFEFGLDRLLDGIEVHVARLTGGV